MFYIVKNKYKDLFKEVVKRDVHEFYLEKKGYSVLHDLNRVGELTNKPVENEDNFTIKFVVIFRSAKSNLVAVKNDSYAIPVEIESYPQGATFDDLILLHGKQFIDMYVNSTDITEFIQHTMIQPWGVVQIENDLFVLIEIVIEDEAITKRLGTLNADFVDETREGIDTITDVKIRHLANGLTPIADVHKYIFNKVSVYDIQNCIIDNLKEVK